MYKLSNIFLFIFLVLFFNACLDDEEDSKASLKSISHSPEQSYLIKNRNLSIETTGHYSDGSSRAMNADLNWTSSDTSIATVDKGLISAIKEGNVSITYSTTDTLAGKPIIQNSINYKVIDAVLLSISITSQLSEIYIDQEFELKVEGVFDIGEENSTTVLNDINWSSDNTEVLSVSSEGVIKGISEGSATISAKDNRSNILTSIRVTVVKSLYQSITVNAPKTSFNVGESMQLEAIGINESDIEFDISDSVTWISSDTDIVTIDENGLAEAIAIGDAYLSAEIESIRSEEILLSVETDQYLKLSDVSTSESLEFPYICNYNMACQEKIEKPYSSSFVVLKTFTLEAVGKDFSITNLSIGDFNATRSWLNDNAARLNGLYENQIIKEGESVEFTLEAIHPYSTQKDLIYSFSIDNESIESFVASYMLVSE